MIGNVSDWLSYAGGALIKVADSAGSTVLSMNANHPRIAHGRCLERETAKMAILDF